jgi:hypothetical protein
MELEGSAPLRVGTAAMLLTLLGVCVAALGRSYVQSSVVYIAFGLATGAVLRSLYGAESQEQVAPCLAATSCASRAALSLSW